MIIRTYQAPYTYVANTPLNIETHKIEDNKLNYKKENTDSNKLNLNKSIVLQPIIKVPVITSPNNNDLIRNYDYSRMYDPLEEPVRRISRNLMYPNYFKNIIDLPTRGYPDNFTQYGILVKLGHLRKNEQNKVLRLFGRQEFPSSNKYQYYTAINSGLDQIKIPLNTKRRNELYDDDIIYIKELNDEYKISLHKYDQPKYYPSIIY